MAINYPTSFDDWTNPTGADTLATSPHSTHHANHYDAIEALERQVGLGSSAAYGFRAWTYDPVTSTNTTTLASTAVFAAGVYLPAGSYANLYSYVTTGQTVTNAFMALYDSAGVFLKQSTNNAANMTTAGMKTYALTSASVLTSGFYYLAIWSSSGGTQPTMLRATNVTALQLNVRVAPALDRGSTSGSGATSTAPSPIGVLTQTTACLWLAAS